MTIRNFEREANVGVAGTGNRRHDLSSRTGGGAFPGNSGAALESPDAGVPRDAAPSALQIFPWWYYPPKGATYFFQNARPNQVVNAGVQNQLLTGSQFVVRQGERAVIVSVSLIVQSPTVADDFFYTLLRNNAPVQGMDQLRNFAVVANASVNGLNGYSLQLEPGDQMSWTVTNNGAAAVTVGLNYLGWSVSIPEIDRLQQGVNY